ncbi:3'-5' exonuclease [Rhodococcoides fascians]|uniref:3'-5' exonuclease n=1 Tax=Rhodococcoides fascians TaxID=1828 RepID=UPI00050BFDDF|nr:hypothetical protein [Rhodococcus fascians]
MSALVFLDTETTGLHPDRRPWEIAMIRLESHSGDAKLKGCTILVSDVDLSQADPMALSIGKFYDRHPNFSLNDGPQPPQPNGTWLFSEESAARKVERWTRGATIVGANPSFDTITLDAMLRRHNLVPSWHHRLVDVESLTAGHLGSIGDDGRLLGATRCADVLGLNYDADQTHTAEGDAVLALRIYRKVVPS